MDRHSVANARKVKHAANVEVAMREVRRGGRLARPRALSDKRSSSPGANVLRVGRKCDVKVGLLRKAAATVKILASGHAPEDVIDARNSKCAACDHLTLVRVDDEIKGMCTCCGCSMWSALSDGSDLGNKNAHAAHACPIGEFGEWSGEDSRPATGVVIDATKAVMKLAFAAMAFVRDRGG